jgi:hypothetical protein
MAVAAGCLPAGALAEAVSLRLCRQAQVLLLLACACRPCACRFDAQLLGAPSSPASASLSAFHIPVLLKPDLA